MFGVFQVAAGAGHQRAGGARAVAGGRRHRAPERSGPRVAQVYTYLYHVIVDRGSAANYISDSSYTNRRKTLLKAKLSK